jgi:hypothetical protein
MHNLAKITPVLPRKKSNRRVQTSVVYSRSSVGACPKWKTNFAQRKNGQKDTVTQSKVVCCVVQVQLNLHVVVKYQYQ